MQTKKNINVKEFIKNKFREHNELIFTKERLEEFLNAFNIKYTISNLTSFWFLTPIKRWKYYLNNFSSEYVNPFMVWGLYFEDVEYSFWWLFLYNRYRLTEQLPEYVEILNTKYSWLRRIGWINFMLKRKRKNFFKKWISQRKINWVKYNVLTKEKAILEYNK